MLRKLIAVLFGISVGAVIVTIVRDKIEDDGITRLTRTYNQNMDVLQGRIDRQTEIITDLRIESVDRGEINRDLRTQNLALQNENTALINIACTCKLSRNKKNHITKNCKLHSPS